MGFTFAAMPGFIVRAVPPHETGSATGFYQVLRSIGLSVGSALSAAVLSVFTHKGNTLPEARGFEVALLIGVGLCVLTAVLSYVIPGRVSTGRALSAHETEEVDELMEENAESAVSCSRGSPLGGDRGGRTVSGTMTDPRRNPGPRPPAPERGGQPTGTARRRPGPVQPEGLRGDNGARDRRGRQRRPRTDRPLLRVEGRAVHRGSRRRGASERPQRYERPPRSPR